MASFPRHLIQQSFSLMNINKVALVLVRMCSFTSKMWFLTSCRKLFKLKQEIRKQIISFSSYFKILDLAGHILCSQQLSRANFQKSNKKTGQLHQAALGQNILSWPLKGNSWCLTWNKISASFACIFTNTGNDHWGLGQFLQKWEFMLFSLNLKKSLWLFV